MRQILLLSVLLLAGCAKDIKFQALPLASSGKAAVRVELTYNRNDTLRVKISNAPEPSTLNPRYTRYVLWVATTDRQSIVNAGQLRVENGKAELMTLTPLRKFILSITAEAQGDATTPGPDVLFQTKEINW